MRLSQPLDLDTGILFRSQRITKTYAIISWTNIFLRQSKMASRITKSQNDLHIVLEIIIKRSITIY